MIFMLIIVKKCNFIKKERLGRTFGSDYLGRTKNALGIRRPYAGFADEL
jgi:hypothetical protein